MRNQLTLEDFLLVAEDALGIPFDELEQAVSKAVAEVALAAPFADSDEIDLYPNPVDQAAICCSEIVLSRPLPEGNTAVAYKCMLEMLVRSENLWPYLSEDGTRVPQTLKDLEAERISERKFLYWVRERVALAELMRCRRQLMTVA